MLNQDSIAIGIGFTQQDFTARLVKYDSSLSPGEVVAGTVLRLEPMSPLIDIGAKVAATFRFGKDAMERVSPGNTRGWGV
ncbi:MAG TPA: hypothetical protein V6D14_28650 [Coleofasciculaceae cyanobacterium]|jgi:hypothetical protein